MQEADRTDARRPTWAVRVPGPVPPVLFVARADRPLLRWASPTPLPRCRRAAVEFTTEPPAVPRSFLGCDAAGVGAGVPACFRALNPVVAAVHGCAHASLLTPEMLTWISSTGRFVWIKVRPRPVRCAASARTFAASTGRHKTVCTRRAVPRVSTLSQKPPQHRHGTLSHTRTRTRAPVHRTRVAKTTSSQPKSRRSRR